MLDVTSERSAVKSEINASSEGDGSDGVSVVSVQSNSEMPINSQEEADVRTVAADGSDGEITPTLTPPCEEQPGYNCPPDDGGGGSGGGGEGDCGPDNPDFYWQMGTDVNQPPLYPEYAETQSYTGATVQVSYLWVRHEVWVNGIKQWNSTAEIRCDDYTNQYIQWSNPSGDQDWYARGDHAGTANSGGQQMAFNYTTDQDFI